MYRAPLVALSVSCTVSKSIFEALNEERPLNLSVRAKIKYENTRQVLRYDCPVSDCRGTVGNWCAVYDKFTVHYLHARRFRAAASSYKITLVPSAEF